MPSQPIESGPAPTGVVNRVRARRGDVLLLSLRVLAARWLGLEPGAGLLCLPKTKSTNRFPQHLGHLFTV
jgi:hypothetical protein